MPTQILYVTRESLRDNLSRSRMLAEKRSCSERSLREPDLGWSSQSVTGGRSKSCSLVRPRDLVVEVEAEVSSKKRREISERHSALHCMSADWSPTPRLFRTTNFLVQHLFLFFACIPSTPSITSTSIHSPFSRHTDTHHELLTHNRQTRWARTTAFPRVRLPFPYEHHTPEHCRRGEEVSGGSTPVLQAIATHTGCMLELRDPLAPL